MPQNPRSISPPSSIAIVDPITEPLVSPKITLPLPSTKKPIFPITEEASPVISIKKEPISISLLSTPPISPVKYDPKTDDYETCSECSSKESTPPLPVKMEEVCKGCKELRHYIIHCPYDYRLVGEEYVPIPFSESPKMEPRYVPDIKYLEKHRKKTSQA